MIAAISSAWVLPALVGPTVAGFVAEQLSWRAVFYGFLPLLAVVGLLSGRTFRPPNPAEERAEKDSPSRLPGALLLTAGGGLLLVGLKVAAGGGLSVFGRELAPSPSGCSSPGWGPR